MSRRAVCLMLAACCWAAESGAVAENRATGTDGESASAPADAAALLAASLAEGELRALVDEALERSPRLATMRATARAAGHRGDRVGGLPDPELTLLGYIEPPQTRVGPQRLMASVTQPLPWGGKRALAAEAERRRAEALEADLRAARLDVVTEVRALYLELAFVSRQTAISERFRAHLVRHEEIARSRYTTGHGGGQGVLKLQAEITRVDRRLIELAARRRSLEARLNGTLGRAADRPVPAASLPEALPTDLDLERLIGAALAQRPELEADSARIAAAESLVGRAEQGFKPDFRVGLTYALVERRDDPAGRLMPPPDNGQDVLGIAGGVSIPLWSRQRHAALEESLELRSAGEHQRVQTATAISARIADLVSRIDLTWKELRLLEDLLVVQAQESLESAQAGYVTGSLNALDLFDADHLLSETETAVARATADYLIGLAELEGAIAGVLPESSTGGAS